MFDPIYHEHSRLLFSHERPFLCCVNAMKPGAYMCLWSRSSLVEVMVCRLFRRQAILWTHDGVLSIELLGTSFSKILIEIEILSLKKMHLKMSSAKMKTIWPRPGCLTATKTMWPMGPKWPTGFRRCIQLHKTNGYSGDIFITEYHMSHWTCLCVK